MRSYFTELDGILEKMKLTGEEMPNSKIIVKLKGSIPPEYDPVMLNLAAFADYNETKEKLIECDETFVSRKKYQVEGELAQQLEMMTVQKPSGRSGQSYSQASGRGWQGS